MNLEEFENSFFNDPERHGITQEKVTEVKHAWLKFSNSKMERLTEVANKNPEILEIVMSAFCLGYYHTKAAD